MPHVSVMDSNKIHIISRKQEICSLIMKSLDPDKYSISCTHGEDISEDFIKSLEGNFDCLILDKGIDEQLSRTITEKFHNIPIVCLPSLDDGCRESGNIRFISEPFKLSELRKVLEEICEA